MGRSLTLRAAPMRIGAASLCGLAVAVGAGSLRAQEGGAASKTLTFGLSQRFEVDSNYDLDNEIDSGSDGATYIASTDLSLDFRSATRGQTLDLGVGGSLRQIDAPDEADSESFGFYDPNYSAAYTRVGPGSSLNLDASLRSSEISFLRRLDFLDDEGVLVIPEDIDDLNDLEGTGTRQTLSYGASLAVWQDTRFGVTARARMRDTTYEDTTDPGLFDKRSTLVGVETRMLLTEIHTLTTDLRYTWIEDDDPLEEDNDGGLGLDTTLAFARPGGALTTTLGIDETDDGTRLSLQGGIVRERPLGGIGLSLGVSRGDDGDVGLIGSIDYTRAFPTGQISLQAEQTFDDNDEQVTALVARYGRNLNALTSMSANASFASSTDSATDETASDLSLGLSLSRQLDPDWAVTAGVNATFFQDEGEDDWERSESVYLTLGRSFDWRF